MDSGPRKGSSSILYQYISITFYFLSEENNNAFMANPVKYETHYEGGCSYAMGDRGGKVAVNPETFKIVDGKLYLFYNSGKHNMFGSWNKDETNLIDNADRYWENFVRKIN